MLATYVGEYQFAPDAVTHIKADGDRLYASDDGRSWDELLAQSETVFFFKGQDGDHHVREGRQWQGHADGC